MYSPLIGQFAERDPEGYAAGDQDLYRYCGDAPNGLVDPSGDAPGLLPTINNPNPWSLNNPGGTWRQNPVDPWSPPGATIMPSQQFGLTCRKITDADATRMVSDALAWKDAKGRSPALVVMGVHRFGVFATDRKLSFMNANLGEMLKRLEEAECEYVGVLEFQGHGNSSLTTDKTGRGQQIGCPKNPNEKQFVTDSNNSLTYMDLTNVAYVGKRLKDTGRLTSSSLIVLSGCCTGNWKLKRDVPYLLAEATGCGVLATGGFTTGFAGLGKLSMMSLFSEATDRAANGDYVKEDLYTRLRERNKELWTPENLNKFVENSASNTWYFTRPPASGK